MQCKKTQFYQNDKEQNRVLEESSMNSTRIGIKKWLAFIIAGLVGQLAWAIENNYLNLYVFDCSHDYNFIRIMTALSAVAATITTLFIGALSDRLGKRKLFISVGYILWGISIIAFAFLDPTSNITIVANSGFLAGVMIVVMDCVMTFFGSTANDACFNATVSDHTDETNRGKIDSVLSVLPLFALIAVTVVGGIFGISNTNGDPVHWDYFFYLFGGLTTVIGVLCIFIYPKDVVSPNKDNYFKNIIYGFRPKVVKDNINLYLVLASFMIFNIAIQVFMPYFMIYIQRGLGIQGDDFTITLGVVLVVASAITVAVGLFMDRIGRTKVIYPALIISIIGAIVMFFIRGQIGVIIGGIVLMAGYLVSTAILASKTRDYIPDEKMGVFQGVRMVFVVMLPMVIGPYIGQGVSYINVIEYTNEYGITSVQPNEYIFLFAAIVLLLVFVPLVILTKREKQNEQPNVQSAAE